MADRPVNRHGRERTDFPAVPAAQIGGVVVGSHTLTKQATLLASLTRRALRRLDWWFKKNPDCLPSDEWIESFRYTAANVVNLLKEQRERAKDGSPPVPTEVLDAQMRHQFALAAGTFTEADLEILGAGLKPEAWAVLDRIRGERFGDGQWIVDDAEVSP